MAKAVMFGLIELQWGSREFTREGRRRVGRDGNPPPCFNGALVSSREKDWSIPCPSIFARQASMGLS